jgi:hypothetical protein
VVVVVVVMVVVVAALHLQVELASPQYQHLTCLLRQCKQQQRQQQPVKLQLLRKSRTPPLQQQ